MRACVRACMRACVRACVRKYVQRTQPAQTPAVIAALRSEHVVAMAAGDRHSLFLTDEGQVWACGDNESGQLGLDPRPHQTKDG